MGEIYIYRRDGYDTPLQETTSSATSLLGLVRRTLKRDVLRTHKSDRKKGVLGWCLNMGDKGDREEGIQTRH